MAMGNAANVSLAKPKTSGSISYAPLGTTLPTDAKTDLADTYTHLGYISEDGVTNSNSGDSGTVNAWGGDPVLYTHGAKTDTFQFSLLEALNVDVLKAVYNSDNVTGTLATGISVKAGSDDPEGHVWVIDMALKDGAYKRIVIPHGEITGLEDISYNNSDPIGYNVTVSALPVDGATHHEYIVRPAST